MTQGIFIHGSRPTSKKQIKEVVDAIYRDQLEVREGEDRLAKHQHDLYCVVIEATSLDPSHEFDGSLAEAERRMNLHREQGKALLEGKLPAPDHDNQALDPRRAKFTFVGPDPYTSRKFYGTIEYNITKGRWTVK